LAAFGADRKLMSDVRCVWYLPHRRRSELRKDTGEVEAIEVHHLGPCRYEVFHKLLLRVRARICFREGAQLRVPNKDQVDTGAGPPDSFVFQSRPS
jgi:hypothetical protein